MNTSDNNDQCTMTNGNLHSKLTMNNDNNVVTNVDIEKINSKYDKSRYVDMVAQKLCDIFQNPDGFKYYCKIVWRLQPSVIWSNVEVAKRGKNPARLFTYLCKRCMGE